MVGLVGVVEESSWSALPSVWRTVEGDKVLCPGIALFQHKPEQVHSRRPGTHPTALRVLGLSGSCSTLGTPARILGI